VSESFVNDLPNAGAVFKGCSALSVRRELSISCGSRERALAERLVRVALVPAKAEAAFAAADWLVNADNVSAMAAAD
jgi:hypothetical protein